MTHASVFSGIGGPEVAADMLGWNNLFHCEIEDFKRKILEYWYPNEKSYKDITTTDFSEWRGKVDVLTGGFPCQPFSNAGKRRGAEDPRYLWPYMLRCIQQVRPTWFIAENVNGIRSMVLPGEEVRVADETDLFGETHYHTELRQQFVLNEICEQIEKEGYSVQPIVIPACSVGAPHQRYRIFIVAHSDSCYAEGNTGTSRETEEEERLQERNEVYKFGESDYVRRPIKNSMQERVYERDNEVVADEQGSRNAGTTGDDGKTELPVANTTCDGHTTQEANGRSDCKRSRNNVESEERKQQTKRTDGLFEIQSSTDTVEIGRNAVGNEFGEFTESQQKERGEVEFCRTDITYLQNRWRDFPTVSPIHRGNDGIPFSLDDLTIPEEKWRRGSLESYGDAIVPQVIYMIFQAIERVECAK